ncbi:hypothetical protein DEO72_LG5g1287 [Vigna unguiculata]|uniref:Uncharacterized protein n=1 Tax=Vigna unguiculata TaxID=3917 RepID=A0A4D6LX13_VIGUN|nr:hypothetical protein DEO72_LG5g1287 [Vigna unguiculata]
MPPSCLLLHHEATTNACMPEPQPSLFVSRRNTMATALVRPAAAISSSATLFSHHHRSHGSHREFVPAPAPPHRAHVRTASTPFSPAPSSTSIASMAATTSHSRLLLPPPSSPTVTPLPPVTVADPTTPFATILQPPRQPP